MFISKGRFYLMWTLAVVVLVMVGTCNVAKADNCSAANSLVNSGIEIGFIGKISYSNFYVNESIWRCFNVDQKETFLFGYATYYKCNGGGALMCTVYSYRSGRKLAKFNTWGYDFY